MSQTRAQVLREAVQSNLMLTEIYGSKEHREMIAEILAMRKHPGVEVKPSVKGCGKCNSCKSNSRYGCIHNAKPNDWQAVGDF